MQKECGFVAVLAIFLILSFYGYNNIFHTNEEELQSVFLMDQDILNKAGMNSHCASCNMAILLLLEWLEAKKNINTRRKARIKTTCNKYKEVKSYEEKVFDRKRFIVSNEKKLVACHIPKMASTMIHQFFMELTGGLLIRTIPDDIKENYTSFITVREPVERLASAYYERVIVGISNQTKQEKNSKKLMDNVKKANAMHSNGTMISFSDFIQYTVLPLNDSMKY